MLKRGSLIKLMAGHEYVVYARSSMEEAVIVVIHNGPDEIELDIPVWLAGVEDSMEIVRVLRSDAKHYNVGITKRRSENGQLVSKMLAYTGKVYYINKKKRLQ